MTTPNDSNLIILDSSAWLEYLTDDANASSFAPFIEGDYTHVVPTVVIYEVFRKLNSVRGKLAADQFASQVLQKEIVALTSDIAFSAAILAADHQLPMADAMIYATAQYYHAELVTGDTHFRGLPGVTLV